MPVPFIINSKLAKSEGDRRRPLGDGVPAQEPGRLRRLQGGERWSPGQQLVYERNDDWVGGPTPGVKRVVLREVPSPATRRALIERGDVQLSFNISNKDAKELAEKMDVFSTPIENCMHVVGLNYAFEPFQDPDVRKAVAYAIPYEEIFQTAAYGRGVPTLGRQVDGA